MDERPTPRRSASSRSGGRRSPVRRAPDETRVWIWAITASGTEGGLRIRARPMLVMSTGDQTSGSIQTRPRSCQGGYHGMRLPWKPRCAFPVGRARGSLDWISSRPGQVHRTRRLDCARRCRDGAVEVARAPGRGEPETGGLAQLSPPIVERAERLVDPQRTPICRRRASPAGPGTPAHHAPSSAPPSRRVAASARVGRCGPCDRRSGTRWRCPVGHDRLRKPSVGEFPPVDSGLHLIGRQTGGRVPSTLKMHRFLC